MPADDQASCRIGIIGSYGGLNVGDEAILATIIDQLRKRRDRVDFTVFSRDAEDTLLRHRVERAVTVRSMSRNESRREIESLDLLLVGGGGILFDHEAKHYLREALIAEDVGVKVMVFAVGAGPLHDRESREIVRAAVERAAAVTVREISAKHLLEELGIRREILVTADPALLLEMEPLPPNALLEEGLDTTTGRRLISMSVREPGPAAPDLDERQYHDALANAADFLIDRLDADVVFIPMEHRSEDIRQAHAVMARMLRPQRASMLRKEYSPGQLLALMNVFSLAVGMRLHFLLLAALRCVPFVGLPYAPKVKGFLEQMDMVSPPINLVSAGRLTAHIDRAWDEREAIARKICSRLPAAKALAFSNVEIALRLLGARP